MAAALPIITTPVGGIPEALNSENAVPNREVLFGLARGICRRVHHATEDLAGLLGDLLLFARNEGHDVVDDAVFLSVSGDRRFFHLRRNLLSLLGNFARLRRENLCKGV